jgi:hypothetical protein
MDPQQNTTPEPVMTPPQAPEVEDKKSPVGPIVGAIIIIVIIIFGGLYFWGSYLENQTDIYTEALPFLLGDGTTEDEVSMVEGLMVEEGGLPPVSTSDTVSDIEDDIEAMDFDVFEEELEADLADIEVQL